MANKNFTQFGLSSFASNADYLVGYSKDDNQELRYTVGSVLTGGNYDFIINGVNIGRGQGANNIVFGTSGALAVNTSTDRNIAVGSSALASLTGFGENIAIGHFALSGLRDDGRNIAIGNYSLMSAVGCSQSDPRRGVFRVVNNVGLGNEALISALTANSCTSLGNYSLQAMLSGALTTAVGNNAGYLMQRSINNTLLGAFAGSGTTGGLFNCTMLGYSSQVTGNNQVQLGDSATTTYAYGAVADRSDIRDKADVRDTTLGLNFIMALRPVDFKWDFRDSYRTLPPATPSPDATEEAKENHRILMQQWSHANDINNIVHDGTHKRTRYHHGLIAQEVKQVLDAKGIDFGGYQDHSIKGGKDVLSIGYNELVAPLIKAIQELKQEFDAYKASHP
jgi:hypothetical protein